jgi:hypothetical protein
MELKIGSTPLSQALRRRAALQIIPIKKRAVRLARGDSTFWR